MGDPTEKTCKLLRYLVETCPAALEVRNSDGATPLMTAFWLGRTEFAKILIDAGADQSVRNKKGENILHLALENKPKASQLQPLIDLIDKDLLQHLFLTRSSLHESGTTPLHAFVSAVTTSQTQYYYSYQRSYKKKEHWLATLDLLLSCSKGVELEMLNGAGDTCLHTAVMQSSEPMVEALVRFKPRLLYRENAVGRTSAEVARDKVTSGKFQQPSTLEVPSTSNSVSSIVNKSPESFVGKDSDSSSDKSTSDDEKTNETNVEKVWRVCLEAMKANPDKRRLVSLNEANDVAKRLGEKYNSSRYFSIQARGEDDDVEEEQPEQEEGEKKADEEKNARDVIDFSVTTRGTKTSTAWKKWMKDCEKCGGVHSDESDSEKDE